MLDKTLELCKKLDLALCVCSSNSYKDVWDLFYFYWNKNSSQYKIPIYFLTSEKTENTNSKYKVVYPISYNSLDPWSNRIEECLKKIDHRNIITTTEDAIINKEIETKKFFNALYYFDNNNLDYLKISPFYPNKCKEKNNSFVSHADWELHRVNITKAIWKKNSLLKLIKKDETFNEFDMFASIRAKEYNMKIEHCNFTTIPYQEIIHGGKFNFNSKKILSEFNYFEKYNRKFNSTIKNFIILFKYFKLNIYSIMPTKIKKILIYYGLIGYKKKYHKKIKIIK